MSTQADRFKDVRVVGFDLDQTLYPKSPDIDTMIQKYLYEKIAEHRGIALIDAELLFKELYRDGSGLSGRQTLESLGLSEASNLVQEALERADIAAVLRPDQTVNRFLAELRVSCDGMDLITGSNLSQTQKKLAALGLSPESFTHCLTEDQASKSDGAAYRLWLSLYPHLPPRHFLYIGDRVQSDHVVPAALGIRTALVNVRAVDAQISVPQLPSLLDLRGLLPAR
ncbi:MAG: HAD family hydrolase [bacterium]